jgi:hypothetical protein
VVIRKAARTPFAVGSEDGRATMSRASLPLRFGDVDPIGAGNVDAKRQRLLEH